MDLENLTPAPSLASSTSSGPSLLGILNEAIRQEPGEVTIFSLWFCEPSCSSASRDVLKKSFWVGSLGATPAAGFPPMSLGQVASHKNLSAQWLTDANSESHHPGSSGLPETFRANAFVPRLRRGVGGWMMGRSDRLPGSQIGRAHV